MISFHTNTSEYKTIAAADISRRPELNVNDIKATLCGCGVRLLKRHTGPFRFRRRWLERTQWLGSEELKQLQLKLLNRMVRHAYETVPYYTSMMDKTGIGPDEIQSLEDIKKFPIIRKADVKAAGETLVSKKYHRFLLRTAHTGGTTGLPVPVRRNLWSIENEHAFARRQFDWAGAGMNQRCAYLEGRVVTSANAGDKKLYVYDAAMKELTLSSFHLTAETVGDYAEAIKAYGIRVLVAYPSSAYVLAKGCIQQGISLPLRCVLTTSETLDEGKRKIISQVFGCKVFDFYGSAERVCYIHTCEHGSYHVIPEYGLTEFLPAEAPNDDCCRIVATGFWNMAMPLIRYDIGDLIQASDENCPCGRNFPVVARIFGRDGNVITTPSGRMMGASAIEVILAKVLYGLYDMPVMAGQVVYEPDNLLTLEYVPMAQFGEKETDKLKDLLGKQVPSELKINIRQVDNMNRTPRGKFVSFVMAQHH